MPRKRKPDPQKVHPGRIIDLQTLSYDSDGYRYANLVLPGVPPNQVEAIGHACALAILNVLKWPDDKAAEMAARVSMRLAAELAERIKWDDAARADSAAATAKAERQMSGADDMDDNIPF